jgi:hypothetical protein
MVLPSNVFMSYGAIIGCGTNKKIRKGFSIVWLAYVWPIWKARNDRVFNNIDVIPPHHLKAIMLEN